MEEYSVSLRDVHFKYENARTEAVAGVSLDVRKGEMLAILGRNGSGKSTLGKLMNDPSIYDNLNHTVQSADSLVSDLKAHPKRYVHFSVFGKKEKK